MIRNKYIKYSVHSLSFPSSFFFLFFFFERAKQERENERAEQEQPPSGRNTLHIIFFLPTPTPTTCLAPPLAFALDQSAVAEYYFARALDDVREKKVCEQVSKKKSNYKGKKSQINCGDNDNKRNSKTVKKCLVIVKIPLLSSVLSDTEREKAKIHVKSANTRLVSKEIETFNRIISINQNSV